ncbi:hypothetical protein HPB50_012244 [Hyalomma asiaticum]|uniref:Uncharacterized protein n=1 Tax=Hyalomma asiaticum TaxID=266040 RepID=A0ACB7TC13_HYAAI|nr:hypothetical protein HPB50_012244 [Hyalomma asiaticum]
MQTEPTERRREVSAVSAGSATNGELRTSVGRGTRAAGCSEAHIISPDKTMAASMQPTMTSSQIKKYSAQPRKMNLSNTLYKITGPVVGACAGDCAIEIECKTTKRVHPLSMDSEGSSDSIARTTWNEIKRKVDKRNETARSFHLWPNCFSAFWLRSKCSRRTPLVRPRAGGGPSQGIWPPLRGRIISVLAWPSPVLLHCLRDRPTPGGLLATGSCSRIRHGGGYQSRRTSASSDRTTSQDQATTSGPGEELVRVYNISLPASLGPAAWRPPWTHRSGNTTAGASCCCPGPLGPAACRVLPAGHRHASGVFLEAFFWGPGRGPWHISIVVVVVRLGPARPARAIPEGPPPAEAFSSPVQGLRLFNVVLVLFGLGRRAGPSPATTASATIQEAASIHRGRVFGTVTSSAATAGRASLIAANVQPVTGVRIADGSSACATGAEPFPGRRQAPGVLPRAATASLHGGGCPPPCPAGVSAKTFRPPLLRGRPPGPRDVPGAAPVPAVPDVLHHGRGPAQPHQEASGGRRQGRPQHRGAAGGPNIQGPPHRNPTSCRDVTGRQRHRRTAALTPALRPRTPGTDVRPRGRRRLPWSPPPFGCLS